MNALPHWDLTNVFPGLESAEFVAAIADIEEQTASLEAFLAEQTARHPALDESSYAEQVFTTLAQGLALFNELLTQQHTMNSYIYSFVSTDSHNAAARKKMSEFDQLGARIETLETQWQSWIGKLGPLLEEAIAADAFVQAHAFYLREMAEQAKYLMGEAEEELATALSLSGAQAWQQLQRTITSQLTVDFELDGTVQKLPVTKLINLNSHSNEDVRRRAYEAENQAWTQVREPLAAALNGVKGTVNVLNARRGRVDALHSAIDAARIDRETLEAMMGAIESSFPMFRRYFKAKAKHLGKEQLAWWDIFAPVGKSEMHFTWEETRQFMVENFAEFSTELADFANHAFTHRWMDAEPREGKVGGGFCMSLPGVKETRILVNFDGSLKLVSTVAHELGHGYHAACLYARDKTKLQSLYPMTLAETASLMCETIALEAVLEQAQSEQEELAILEEILNGAAQVTVDITSRFLFEREVFERRAQAELSADELCEIMERAQLATYGDALNPAFLQKYMWTWKPHYYRASLSFYNFPYAFGLLFSNGLYAIYQQRGATFVEDYNELLASTGEGNAAELAARFGIDLRSRKFWEDSLAIFEKYVTRFAEIANPTRP